MSNPIRACLLAAGLVFIATPAPAHTSAPETLQKPDLRQHLAMRFTPTRSIRQRQRMMKLHMLLMQLGTQQLRSGR